MDGFKERLKYSLQFRLAWVMSLVIVLTSAAGGALSFYGAFENAYELQDDVLWQVAALVQQQPIEALSLQEMSDPREDTDPESNLIVQALPANGGGLALSPRLVDGLHSVSVDGTSYRTYVKTLADGRRIAVSQESWVRDDIALDSALLTLLPLLCLVPLLLLLVIGLTRRMLEPVNRLAAEADTRDERNVQPLAEADLPLEVRPFVRAINRLFVRLDAAMDQQRRFVADAAHELRSPLTALSLQAERLGATPLPAEARARLATLRTGIERGRTLLEQLLDFARVQGGRRAPAQSVAVRMVFRRVLEDLMPLAEVRQLDVGIVEGAEVSVLSYEMDLHILLRNLVGNAIRYTPPGGRVDLSVREQGGQAILEIEDNGTGIPLAERERVLDPFYRVLGTGSSGSGLGLPIVKAVVEQAGGRLELLDATQFAQGLKVRVTLTAACPPA